MPPSLAKLTRPRLFGAVARARLFQLLDERREHPLVWVYGPPGAGKTTLVASYVSEREIPGLWYQVDSGDGDPATFFYYMGLAAERTVRGKPPLPLLTEESLPDLRGFARRYARELFARLPEGATVVLDNVQEVPADSPLCELLEVLAEETPDGTNLLCISRVEPPPSLMRQVSTGRLATIDWNAMRLTMEETRHIAAVKHKISDQVLTRLHEQSEGWAAGLTLMLERIEQEGDLPESTIRDSHESVFSYFAGTLFDRQPADVRHVLLCTALLPRITPSLASRLTGNSNAGKLLDSLHRRHLFTNRRQVLRSPSSASAKHEVAGSNEPVYEYHALFRQFLMERAREDYTPSALKRLSQDVAALLEESGQVEEAIELNRMAEDWDAVARLAIDHAPELIRQGRGQTLREWISALPAEIAQNLPYAQFWSGVALLAVDQAESQVLLERAFMKFEQSGDRTGQLLCAARTIEAIYRIYVSSKDLDRWIEVLDRLLAEDDKFTDYNVELRVYCSLGLATFHRQPRHPGVKVSAERVAALMEKDLDPEQRVTAGECLNRYFGFSQQEERLDWVIKLVSPAADDSSVPPLNRLYWWGRAADCLRLFGRFEEADAALRKAESLAEHCPGHYAWVMIRFFRVMLDISLGRMSGLANRVTELKQIANPFHPRTVGLALQAEALAAAHSRSLDDAVRICRSTLAAHEAAGHRFGELLAGMILAGVLAQTHETGESLALVEGLRRKLPDAQVRRYGFQLSIIEAYVAIQQHRTNDACEVLRRAFIAQAEPSFDLLRTLPRIAGAVLSFAIEQGIETQCVKACIRRFSIPAEGDCGAAWPWPVKLRCMGKFQISIDDQPLQFKGRAPAKPLELLKLLISSGPNGLPARAIADHLWPDLDGAAALVNVDTNVHRVRKLFRGDPLVVSEGRVAINGKQCWVDAWELEHIDATRASLDSKALQDRVRYAMHLYEGHFLDLEGEQSWAVGYREKLRAAFIGLVAAAGRTLEQEGKYVDAIKFYEQAVKLDNLAEPIYRQWMLCHRERGEAAEALKVYRRCKEMLSIVLGLQPSADTQAVMASLKN